MIPEMDVWRAAQLMLKQHRDRAAEAAGERAAELEKAGDAAGHLTWLKITAAVRKLQRMPDQGEVLN